MKKLILSSAFLYSSLVFASIDNCRSLDGTYACSFQGQNVTLDIQIENSTNQMTIDIEGEGGQYIVDGTDRLSDDQVTTYNASCLANGTVELDNYYQGTLEGSVTLEQFNENEVLYTMVKEGRNGGVDEVQLNCSK